MMLTLVIAGASLAPCSAPLAEPSKEPPVQRLSAQDAKFLHDLLRADLIAIRAGNTALERARVQGVKKSAQLMVDTHSKMLEEGEKLAKFKLSPVPGGLDEASEALPDVLRKVPDDRFDRVYMAWAVDALSGTLGLAKRVTAEASDPNLKALATKTAAHLEKQLEICRELARALDAQPERISDAPAPRSQDA